MFFHVPQSSLEYKGGYTSMGGEQTLDRIAATTHVHDETSPFVSCKSSTCATNVSRARVHWRSSWRALSSPQNVGMSRSALSPYVRSVGRGEYKREVGQGAKCPTSQKGGRMRTHIHSSKSSPPTRHSGATRCRLLVVAASP